MSDLANYEHIFGSVYVVRTQAGFKQACKHFMEREVPDQTSGYPTTYPSVISLEYAYNGGCYVLVARCENLTLVKAKLEKH